MKALKRISLLFPFVLASFSQAADRVESYVWQVGDSPIIKLEVPRGAIVVERTPVANEVTLLMQASSGSNDSDSWLSDLNVKARPFGAGLLVQVNNASTGVEVGIGDAPERELQLVLRVPTNSNLDLSTHLGSVEICNDLKGAMRVRTRDGNVFVGRVDGSVTVDAVRGNITVARATGDLKAKTGIGDVQVGTILGRAELQAKNGNIAVMSAQGDLDAEATHGDVAANFGRQLPEKISLKASVGNVNVAIDPAAALRVDAKAAWGKVKSQIAFEPIGANGKRKLEGVVNGGGPTLALRADGGNITINAVPTFEDILF